MITVYITGRVGFEEAIQNKLKYSWLRGNSDAAHSLIMFWLEDHSQLKNFKLAIGARLIFKYRLRFITNLEEHLQSLDNFADKGLFAFERRLIFDIDSRQDA